ncbi:MAG TPA: M67 family metallopeptidase [Gammaproteobacteria bacterium]
MPHIIVSQLVTEAKANTEVEICGLISKKDNETFRVYPIDNIASEKHHRFEMEPAQQIAAMKTMRDNNETLFAIYHTHPHGTAEPSVTDIEQASYPDTLNLIIALDTDNAPEMRGFYLRNGQVEPVKLKK